MIDLRTPEHASAPNEDHPIGILEADISILGDETSHRGVVAPGTPRLPWLNAMPECPALQEFGIIHLGVASAASPYRFVRRNLPVIMFLGCLRGEGRVLINGRWAHCAPGSAVLLPANTTAGYYATGTETWELIRVCYDPDAGAAPMAALGSSVISPYDSSTLYHAVEGLRCECNGANDPISVKHLSDLIHRSVLRYAQPGRYDERLHRVWERVVADLSVDWSLEQLARHANCSTEHLRRLCRQQLGRSPIQHVTHLRLQHATHLLITTNWKLEVIAAEVGYSDPFAFSVMFKRWLGCPPSKYRQRHRSDPSSANSLVGNEKRFSRNDRRHTK